jgi:hypothetical protein
LKSHYDTDDFKKYAEDNTMWMRQISLLALVMLMACAGCKGNPPRENYEKAGGFSYDPPPGWETADFPGMKYKISRGTPQNGFTPNINVVDEQFSGSLSDYVDLNVENIKKVFQGSNIIKREDIQTEDAQPGVKLVVQDQQMGKRLRQTFYFFSNGSRKYVATCSAPADGGEALDTLFETSMKTFRLH